ncbi:hypothetical protein [Candidatus Neptunochlamydia vexilliferae]|uniref:Uncharacterized protein n=1 Tax=Candidatus Neptunichlamydia vexilliferae TaxID=1651774 RepID=A0ABS0B1H9_9BACT|nr:hypothetical protein [Candidatus Neptunochlamydia vexilliferae]MBF5059395.1 hypothetical protein [Candidatus Neptunochlamydia vexilliferae]
MEASDILKVVFRVFGFFIAYGSLCRAMYLLKFHPKKETFKNVRDAIAFFLITFFVLLYFFKIEFSI